ncbi:hypothetical protein JYT83_00540 [bacterium AH-315-F18]|nr:hypothetical protein [bacterium AH-315-F18]
MLECSDMEDEKSLPITDELREKIEQSLAQVRADSIDILIDLPGIVFEASVAKDAEDVQTELTELRESFFEYQKTLHALKANMARVAQSMNERMDDQHTSDGEPES